MRSQLVVRRGVQEPTISHKPPGVVSLAAAEEAIELADCYGVADGCPLSESEKITIRLAGGERADGSWAATRIADFGPRQGTGKNDKIAAWELAHLLLFGTELIIHTAHEFPTANESFLRLVAVFDAWDELRAKVARIRYANGEQGIELLSGQRLKYRARTGGSGRGFAKAGLLVYDEAQHLGAEHVAASGPAKLSHPNSQTWYAGSGGLSSSLKAWEIRRQALLGVGGRLAYTEMTAEDLCVVDGKVRSMMLPDPSDRDVWYRTIPGLGRWVTEEGVEALYDELGHDLFLREILCVWDPDPASQDSLVGNWARLADDGSRIVGAPCIALDVSKDRRWSCFGAAGRRDDGRLHVEVTGNDAQLDHRRGTGWVVERGVELSAAWQVPVRVEKGSPAAAFVTLLREAGADVLEVTAQDHAAAAGQFLNACENNGLRHLGQTSLAAAVQGAVLRSSGDADRWERRSAKVDVTPLVAVTLALGGVPADAVVDMAANVW